MTIPTIPAKYQSAWAQYSVLANIEAERTRLQQLLREKNIPSVVYYPKPLHLQTAYSDLGYCEGDFPFSEDTSNKIFSLPMYPYLSDQDINKIAETLRGT